MKQAKINYAEYCHIYCIFTEYSVRFYTFVSDVLKTQIFPDPGPTETDFISDSIKMKAELLKAHTEDERWRRKRRSITIITIIISNSTNSSRINGSVLYDIRMMPCSESSQRSAFN